MKPFNLEEAKAGKPVCTRSGRAVKLIYFNVKGKYPIVGLIQYEDFEDVKAFKKNGEFLGDGFDDSNDLFMV